jgi:hemerythrin
MMQQGHRAIPHVLEELVNYIQLHFTTEEAAMRKADFPGFESHRLEHLDMTGKVLELREKYLREHALDSGEVLNFLCDWLRNHIMVNDKKFGNFLRVKDLGDPFVDRPHPVQSTK